MIWIRNFFDYFCVAEDSVDRLDDQYYNCVATKIMVHPLEISVHATSGMVCLLGLFDKRMSPVFFTL